METTVTLNERVIDTVGQLTEIYIVKLKTKVRNEKNCFSVKTYGVTVTFFENGTPYIFKNGIYNMTTGKTIFVGNIEQITLAAIADGTALRSKDYTERIHGKQVRFTAKAQKQ